MLALSIRKFNFHSVKELTQIFQATVNPHCGLSNSYFCRRSRRMEHQILAPQSSLLSNNDLETDDYYLAQPMDWMSPELDNREHEGSLACTGCEALVGEYNWNGKQNAGGQWIIPAFVLYRNAVSTSYRNTME